MIFALRSQFDTFTVQHLYCLHSVLNVKALSTRKRIYLEGTFSVIMKLQTSLNVVSSSSFYAVTICKGHVSECSMCSILQSCSCPGESKWQEMVERWLVKVRSGVRVQECTAHCTWHSVAPRWAHCQHSQHSTRPTPGWWHACYLFIH